VPDGTFVGAGRRPHGWVEIRGTLPPLTNGAVTEDDYTSMGEVADLEPGASGTLTASLPVGHHAIICNLPGHLSQGMVADLAVE